MVAGLPNRIYFSANLKNGKPADLAGKIRLRTGELLQMPYPVMRDAAYSVSHR